MVKEALGTHLGINPPASDQIDLAGSHIDIREFRLIWSRPVRRTAWIMQAPRRRRVKKDHRPRLNTHALDFILHGYRPGISASWLRIPHELFISVVGTPIFSNGDSGGLFFHNSSMVLVVSSSRGFFMNLITCFYGFRDCFLRGRWKINVRGSIKLNFINNFSCTDHRLFKLKGNFSNSISGREISIIRSNLNLIFAKLSK